MYKIATDIVAGLASPGRSVTDIATAVSQWLERRSGGDASQASSSKDHTSAMVLRAVRIISETMDSERDRAGRSTLHRAAVRFHDAGAASGTGGDSSPATSTRPALTHVSGATFGPNSLAAGAFGAPVCPELSQHCLRDQGTLLTYSPCAPLGSGRYTTVFLGQEVYGDGPVTWGDVCPSSLRLPLHRCRVGLLSVAHACGDSLPGKLLLAHPLLVWLLALAFAALERATRRPLARALAVVVAVYRCLEVWGPWLLVPAWVLAEFRIRPRASEEVAVKRLLTQPSLGAAGAHGARSAEHEVLVTLHITQACPDCPYLGKARGFDYEFPSPVALSANSPLRFAHQRAPGGPDRALLVAPHASTASLVPPAPRAWLSAAGVGGDASSRGPASAVHAAPAGAPYALAAAARFTAQPRPSALLLSLDLHLCELEPSPPAAFAVAPSGERTAAALQLLAAPARASAGRQPCGSPVTLADYLLWLQARGRVLGLEEATRLAIEVTEALHALHTRAHVMHLDVKPQNVLLDGGRRAKLVDFGFAVAFEPGRPRVHLPHGRGTLRFAAPEMLGGMPGAVTPAADIFSLGGVLLTLTADHACCAPGTLVEPYFNIATHDAVHHHVLYGIPPVVPECVPPAFRTVIRQCLAAHPSMRPSAATVLAHLTALQDAIRRGTVSRTPAPRPPRAFDPPLADAAMRGIVSDSAKDLGSLADGGAGCGGEAPLPKLKRPRRVLQCLQALAEDGSDDGACPCGGAAARVCLSPPGLRGGGGREWGSPPPPQPPARGLRPSLSAPLCNLLLQERVSPRPTRSIAGGLAAAPPSRRSS